MKIAFDIKEMRPGCALIQAAMGGEPGIADTFYSVTWLISPTPDMKIYEVDESQLCQLIEKVEDAVLCPSCKGLCGDRAGICPTCRGSGIR